MCTWAGYIGTQPAASILLEMAKRQEGLWGGFYSGITTLSKGKLGLVKLIGNVNQLHNETEAANLPGNMGLIHSRTNSGGNHEWDQPFLDTDATVGVLAQGSRGLFVDENHHHCGSRGPGPCAQKSVHGL